MEIHIVAAVSGLMAKIFAPVRRIGNLGTGQNGFHFRGQLLQGRNHRKNSGGGAQGRESAQFAANQKCFNTSGQGTEMGIMQDHPAIAPFGRACVIHHAARG